MNMFRAPLIAAAVLAMTSCATFAQVRIITPDSEHLYSTDPRTPGQQLPDDETLQLQNERADRAKLLRLQEREKARTHQELDAAALAALNAAFVHARACAAQGRLVGLQALARRAHLPRNQASRRANVGKKLDVPLPQWWYWSRGLARRPRHPRRRRYYKKPLYNY